MNAEYTTIGIMSGTSLDGMDIAKCQFKRQEKEKWNFEIQKAATIPYSNEWRKKLTGAETLSGYELMLLHNEFGKLTGKNILNFLNNDIRGIDFISSHGHTVFHQPQQGLTLQIGNGAYIAATTGLKTISDFRTLDVALGGQGAPLVPIGDKLLFSEYEFCLNLGGFANISYDNSKGVRVAFDVCPVNIVINHLVQPLNLMFDKNGEIAQSGKINPGLRAELNSLEFYKSSGPKSLGKEWVLENFLPLVEAYKISLENKLRTIYEHITDQILLSMKDKSTGSILITGGGAHNVFLIELLRNKLKNDVIIPDLNTVDFKEALIFAFLGLLRSLGIHNCLSSVTGSLKDHTGGIIHIPE